MIIKTENGTSYNPMEKKDVRRGEMYWVWDAQEDKKTKQIKKTCRPAIIVSHDDFNKRGFEVECVYLTNKPLDDLKTHVTIRSTGLTSTALCEKISTVDRRKIGNFIGAISADEMAQLEICLMISLDLNYPAASAPKMAQEAPDKNERKQDQDGYEQACLDEIAKLRAEIAELQEENAKLEEEMGWHIEEGRQAERREREANAKLVMADEVLNEARAELNKCRGREELLKEMYNDLLRQTIK